MNAIITGASKGIGRAIAIELAQKGYNLILCARNKVDLSILKAELQSYPIEILCIPTDLSVKSNVISFIEQATAFAIHIDVLVNNVGVFKFGSMLDEEDDTLEQQLNINLMPAYYLGKNIGRIMRKQGFGHIFNLCSVASKTPTPQAGSYSVTKAAMYSLNDVLRMELAPFQVKVTAVLPGSTYTASWNGTNIDPRKFVQPEDVAKAISNALLMSSNANVDEIVLKPILF